MPADRTLPIATWDGLRKDVAPHLLEKGELSDAENVESSDGTLSTRQGIKVVRRVPAGSEAQPVLGLHHFDGPRTAGYATEDWLANIGIRGAAGASGDLQYLTLRDLDYAGAGFNAYVDFLRAGAYLPDLAQLGDRVFVCDGVNPNLVLGRGAADSRVAGAYAQAVALTPTQGTGGALTPAGTYAYGVQRVIVANGVELLAGLVTSATVTLTQASNAYKLYCGAASPATFASSLWEWLQQKGGSFKINVSGQVADITGALVGMGRFTTFEAVAANLQGLIQAKAGVFATVTCAWDSANTRFVFSADTTISYLSNYTTSNGASAWDLAANTLHPANGQQMLVSGTSMGTWAQMRAITSGSFVIPRQGARYYSCIGLNFTTCGTWWDIAAAIQTAFRAQNPGCADWTITYEQLGGLWKFVLRTSSPYRDPNYSLTTAPFISQAIAEGSGQDISGVTLGPAGYGLDWAIHGAAVSRPGVGDEASKLLSGTAACGATLAVPSDLTPSVALLLEPYQYPPVAGSSWEVRYRIWRSKHMDQTILYKLADLTQAQLEALPLSGSNRVYTDVAADAALDENTQIDLDDPMEGLVMPSARYIRAWKGRLVSGGTAEYRRGTATISGASKDTLVLNAPAQMQKHDLEATVEVVGETTKFTISAVNVAGGVVTSYTITPPASAARNAVAYVLYRDPDVVYVSKPLPDNIEGYTSGKEVYPNGGRGNRLTGLAEHHGALYAHRLDRVELLEGTDDAWQLTSLPGSPPGTCSARTIADIETPFVYWYTGQCVARARGTGVQVISGPVDAIIRETALHDYDQWTHGVYDPERRRYLLWLFQAGDVYVDGGGNLTHRVPSLCLVWDEDRERWYVMRLGAVSSGIWRTGTGTPYAVIGIPGGVARLNQYTYDHAAIYAKVAAKLGNTSLQVQTSAFGAVAGAYAGLPVYLERIDGTYDRYTVKAALGTLLEIYGTWAQDPFYGQNVYLGAIRWTATTGEMWLTQAPNRLGKLARVVLLFEPDTAANVLKLVVAGTGESASRSVTATKDQNGVDYLELAGDQVGLRSRRAKATVSGLGFRQSQVKELVLETTNEQR